MEPVRRVSAGCSIQNAFTTSPGFQENHVKSHFPLVQLALATWALAFGMHAESCHAQAAPASVNPLSDSSFSGGNAGETSTALDLPSAPQPAWSSSVDTAAADPALASPGSANPAAGNQHAPEPWEGVRHYGPLSRIGIGADVSPLGIGIKPAVVLSEFLDARMLLSFFNYDSGTFEVEGIRGNAKLHLTSVGAAVDAYPWNSIWRVSAGLMLFNGNNVTMTSEMAPGTSFKLDGKTFYSATANALTGATPLTGTGTLGLHSREPEFMVSGGFGRFIPRSDRHWSFPSEFGVIFMGAPTVDVNVQGWVCTDAKQTQCSDISSPASPIAVEFNNSLQAQLTKWRRAASSFSVYPIFSYSVVYSFNFR